LNEESPFRIVDNVLPHRESLLIAAESKRVAQQSLDNSVAEEEERRFEENKKRMAKGVEGYAKQVSSIFEKIFTTKNIENYII
jgi:hypothetical protein